MKEVTTKEYSSEAIKRGILPPKEGTPKDFEKWRESLNPDMMGFDGKEGMVIENEPD